MYKRNAAVGLPLLGACFVTLFCVMGAVTATLPAGTIERGSADAIAASTQANESTMVLYEHLEYKGENISIRCESKPKEGKNSLKETPVFKKMSSLKWKLATGVIVVFYEREDGGGKQFTIWGEGQKKDLFENKFDNEAAAWAWFKPG